MWGQLRAGVLALERGHLTTESSKAIDGCQGSDRDGFPDRFVLTIVNAWPDEPYSLNDEPWEHHPLETTRPDQRAGTSRHRARTACSRCSGKIRQCGEGEWSVSAACSAVSARRSG